MKFYDSDYRVIFKDEGITLNPEIENAVKERLESVPVYFNDCEGTYWMLTSRTEPATKKGYWFDIVDFNTEKEEVTVLVFQEDEPMEGDRLRRHEYAKKALEALV